MEYDIYDGINKEVFTPSSVFIFICRVEIDPEKGTFWPSQRTGERYQAMMIIPYLYSGGINGMGQAGDVSYTLNRARDVSEKYFNDHIRIGTLEEIKNPNTWKIQR